MGTETSYPIGTILTRRNPVGDENDELRVVGGGKELVVTSTKTFGDNFQITGAVARAEYTTDVPDSVLLSQPTYVDPGPSPEQVFNSSQSVGDGLTRSERAAAARASGDLRAAAEAEKTDTGKPTQYAHPDSPVQTPAEASQKIKQAEVAEKVAKEAEAAKKTAKATTKAAKKEAPSE